MSAVPRRGGNLRTGQRGRAAGKAAARGKGGANAGTLHGEALRQRKAPHGAGLVRADGRRGFMPAAAAEGLTFPRLLDHVACKGRQAY